MQGYFAFGCCRLGKLWSLANLPRHGNSGLEQLCILPAIAVQTLGRCRDTLQLSTALISRDRGSALGERRLGTVPSEIFLGTGILCVYIVQLGTPGALSGWIFRG